MKKLILIALLGVSFSLFGQRERVKTVEVPDSASMVVFDTTGTSLSGTNVQEAIVELDGNTSGFSPNSLLFAGAGGEIAENPTELITEPGNDGSVYNGDISITDALFSGSFAYEGLGNGNPKIRTYRQYSGTQYGVAGPTGGSFQRWQQNGASYDQWFFYGPSADNSFQGPGLISYSAAGTVAVPTAVGSGYSLLQIRAHGRDNTGGYNNGSDGQASIRFITTESYTTTARGTKIKLTATNTGSANSVTVAEFGGSATDRNVRWPAFNGGSRDNSGTYTPTRPLYTDTNGNQLQAPIGAYHINNPISGTATTIDAALDSLKNQIRRGVGFATTDGSGDITVIISPGMPDATYSIIATPEATTFHNVVITSKTNNNFTARFFDATGAAITSTGVVLDWIAIDF